MLWHMDVFWVIVMALGLGLLAWYAFSAEPHWVSKDGQAFTCRVQYLNPSMQPEGRWREAKAFIDGDLLRMRPRGGLGKPRKDTAEYTVLRRGDAPPRGRTTYLLTRATAYGQELVVLRIPQKSRAVPHVEALIAAD